MTQEEVLQHIQAFLSERSQMVIATYGEHPWIATVWYVVDKEMNLYFLSMPSTIHARQITDNPQVSIAVADSPQAHDGKKKGLQIFALAEKLEQEQEVTAALELWKHGLQVKGEKYTYENMKTGVIGSMYKVCPKKIRFVNQELWEPDQTPFIEF